MGNDVERYQGSILKQDFENLIRRLDLMMHQADCETLDECYHECECYRDDITRLDTSMTTSCQKILRFILDQLETGVDPEILEFQLRAYEIALHEFYMTFVQQNTANQIIKFPVTYVKHEQLCHECSDLLRKQYAVLKSKDLI